MDLEEIGINTSNWVNSAQDMNYWRALANAALNLQVPYFMELVNILNIIDIDEATLQFFINTYTVSDVNEEFNRKNVTTLSLAAYHHAKRSFCCSSGEQITLLASGIMLT